MQKQWSASFSIFLIYLPQRLLFLWFLVFFGNKLTDAVFFYIFHLWHGRFREYVVCRILEEYTLFWILSSQLCVQLDSGSFFRRSRRLSGKN